MVAGLEMPKCAVRPLLNVQDTLPVSLARALDWLDARPDEPIRLEALAAVAGVRPRTLEAHFKLYGKDQRVGIFGELTEGEVRDVLASIRKYCK